MQEALVCHESEERGTSREAPLPVEGRGKPIFALSGFARRVELRCGEEAAVLEGSRAIER